MTNNISHTEMEVRQGVVTLFGYGTTVRVDRGHLVLEDGIGKDRRFGRFARVGHSLRRVVAIGSDGMVSLAALRWLADQDASFVMLDRDGSVLATTGPVRSSDAKLRRAQALALTSGAALRITRELIKQKLLGQELVTRNKLLNSTTGDTIAKLSAELPDADSIASVRLIEAQAALAYWTAWRTISINFPKNALPRVPNHWLAFGTRISPLTGSPRLSVNPPNAILNYLYAVLESEARIAAAAMGLDPGLGVLHVDTGSRDSLALDILEPIRPQVDSYVLGWITQQPLKREWFFEQRDGNCRLAGSFAVRLSETASTWRRAVAPISEWVAQALWNSVKSQASSERDRATPLTQRRRSEGRGKMFMSPRHTAIQQLKVCEVCGAEDVQNRYCRSCAVEVSRENMSKAALIGLTTRKTKRTKTTISKKLSNHAVANTWWMPASLPHWLTEQCYLQKIQPCLRTVRVKEIADAIKVSAPYAALIRKGCRKPHPRHWQVLAKLVNIAENV